MLKKLFLCLVRLNKYLFVICPILLRLAIKSNFFVFLVAATMRAVSVTSVQNIASAPNFTTQHQNVTFNYFGNFDNMKSGWNSGLKAGLSVGFFILAGLFVVGGALLYRRSLSSKKGVINNEDGDVELS